MRQSALLLLFMILAACTGSVGRVASDLNNACVIVQENPSFLKAFKKAERNWGIPISVQMAVMYQESKFKSNARTPYRFAMGVIPMGRVSSAYGYSQALDATWADYKRATGKRGARRNRIGDATDFMGWYMDQSNQRLGIAKTDARNQYLAYHEGRGGYSRRTYRRKPWLMRIAGEIESRNTMYQEQLVACGKA